MDEISVRVAQRVAILGERSGWARHVNLPSDEQLLSLLGARWTSTSDLVKHLRTRSKSLFFPSFNTKDQTLSELRRRWPEAEEEIVAAANRLSEGTFSVLGLRELKLGKEIDWHLEPTSGKRTP